MTDLVYLLQLEKFHPVVPFNPSTDKLLQLDFTEANAALTAAVVEDITLFSAWVDQKLQSAGAKYGIGGYGEHRTVYSRSRVFDDPSGGEPRRLHLGTDIWGTAGTPVYAPMDGVVHSFAFNNAYGDYGATIILRHTIGETILHSLYGHLSLRDLDGLDEGKPVLAGTEIAHFGVPAENGHWPPHLHFQLILDMENKQGDYPGVCRYSEREKYLSNCPDPDSILRLMQFAL
jgi:murein DD-endopeptidase MepM/ murein hydrolase activator NlpD